MSMRASLHATVREIWHATVLLLCLAVVFGIWLGSLSTLPGPLLAAMGCAAVAAAALGRRRRALWLPALLLAGLVLGAGRYASERPPSGPGGVAYYLNRDITLTGTVDAEPEPLGRSLNVRMKVESVTFGGRSRRVVGLVQARLSGYSVVGYGDRLILSGTLQPPPDLPGSARGSYRAYLAAQGIYGLLYYPAVQHLPAQSSGLFDILVSGLRGLAIALRRWLEDGIRRSLPGQEAVLLAGILLGAHTRALGSLTAPFTATGMTRLLAIDGFKVSLFIGTIDAVAGRVLGPRRAVVVTLPVLLLYILVTGATPAGLRSGLMWFFAVVAIRFGRRSDAVTSLAMAAAVIALANPHVLWDVGFQLSITGTAGIVVLNPGLERLLGRLPTVIRETLATTLAAQVGTLPVLAAGFGQVSLAAPLANVLLLPLLTPIMVLGFPLAIIGALLSPLGQLAGLLVYPWLAVLSAGTQLLARLPLAALPAAGWPAALVALYYALAGLVARRLTDQADGPAMPALHLPARGLLAGGAVLIVAAVAWQWPRTGYGLTVLNLGRGQALLLRTPSGRTILIDGADRPDQLAAALGTRLPFWQTSLDAVLSTGTDVSHIAGLRGLTAHYSIARELDPGAVYPGVDYALWRAELRDANVPESKLRRGGRYRFDASSYLDVLLPGGLNPEAPVAPVALRLVVGGRAILLLNRMALDGFDPTLLLTKGAPRDSVLVLPAGGDDPTTYAVAVRTVRPKLVVLPSLDDQRDDPAADRQICSAARAVDAATWQGGQGTTLDLLVPAPPAANGKCPGGA